MVSRRGIDQNSLATYNGIGAVTHEGVVDAPNVRDTYIDLRVNAERLRCPRRVHPHVRSRATSSFALPVPLNSATAIECASRANSPRLFVIFDSMPRAFRFP